ncbi:hypothetical protein AWQ24_14740 (plasmid) [Picosynechococcus sp. PCC 8807]|nr:hypothetical protein AWQ24_14740 [Picosynechococcus sp. PCC 8807]
MLAEIIPIGLFSYLAAFHVGYLAETDEIAAIAALIVWVVLVRAIIKAALPRFGSAWAVYRRQAAYGKFWVVLMGTFLVSVTFSLPIWVDLILLFCAPIPLFYWDTSQRYSEFSPQEIRRLKSISYKDLTQ